MVRRLLYSINKKGVSHAGWFVTLALWILLLGPLIAVLMQVIMPGFFYGNRQFGQIDLLLEIFKRPLWQRALYNSLTLSISTAVLGTLLGTILAFIRSRWIFPTAKLLDFSVWLLLITPSFILAQGWVLFASKNGVAEHWLGINFASSVLLHPVGLIFIMVLSKFPLAYLAVYAALEWQVVELEHAARLSGATRIQTWLNIHIPLLKPAIGSGAALVFMDAIGDFGLPSAVSAVYRFPTLPYTIYTSIYTSPIRFDMAGVLSFYLFLIILAAIYFQFVILKGARYDSLTARAKRTKQRKMTSKSWVLPTANLLFLFVAIGIPLGCTLFISLVHLPSNGLTLTNFTISHYTSLFSQHSLFTESLLRSLKIATIAALIGLLLGATIAYVLVFVQFRLKHLLEAMSLVGLAVPGVVLGIGYILVWNQKWLEPFGLMLYGEPSILILAAIASTIPLITRIVSGTMSKIPKPMLDVAYLQGSPFSTTVFTILMPLCKAALTTAALTAFGTSMFDLAINSILFPPGQFTLPVMINKTFEDLKFGQASAATVLSGSFVTLIIVFAIKLIQLKQRKGSL